MNGLKEIIMDGIGFLSLQKNRGRRQIELFCGLVMSLKFAIWRLLPGTRMLFFLP